MRLSSTLLRACLVFTTVLFFAGYRASAGMIETESLKPWEVCALCHNLNGIGRTARFPHLAGQRAAYIRKQLKDFRAGHRTNDNGQMISIVEAELSEANIPVVAEYFASLAPPSPKADDVAAIKIARGKNLVETGDPDAKIPACATCHGAVKPAIAYTPHISSQHADYLAKQLTDFKTGARNNDKTGTMVTIAARLSEADIESVSVYLAGQQRATR